MLYEDVYFGWEPTIKLTVDKSVDLGAGEIELKAKVRFTRQNSPLPGWFGEHLQILVILDCDIGAVSPFGRSVQLRADREVSGPICFTIMVEPHQSMMVQVEVFALGPPHTFLTGGVVKVDFARPDEA
jgi:hypothetical protein